MPKAAVYENHFLRGWEDDIWMSRQIIAVQSKAIAHSMYKRTYQDLGFGIATSYAPHIFAAANGTQ
jgi:hypothetical protein